MKYNFEVGDIILYTGAFLYIEEIKNKTATGLYVNFQKNYTQENKTDTLTGFNKWVTMYGWKLLKGPVNKKLLKLLYAQN